MSDELIRDQFENAVLRIETKGTDRDMTGTGYLIDTQRGYVLTAYHVVERADHKEGTSIEAMSPGLPAKTILKLEVLAKAKDPDDTALLKIIDPSSLIANKIQALDIALHFPESTHYYTMGYPRGNNKPHAQAAEFLAGDDNDGALIDIKQNVDDGSSGSPLIDANGAVLATCLRKIYINEAVYSPLANEHVQELLDQVRPDGQVDILNREIRTRNKAKRAVQDYLIDTLPWKSGKPTNLELYEWNAQNEGLPGGRQATAPYFACPIFPAFSDRRLTEAKSLQASAELAPPSLHADLLLDVANQNLLLRRPALALSAAQRASEFYGTLGDSSGQAKAKIALGQANLGLREFQAARDQFEFVARSLNAGPERAKAEVALAQAYIGMGDSGSAVAHVWSALPVLQNAGDRKGQALAFETLGRAAERQGDYKIASSHFKTSIKLYGEVGDTIAVNSTNRELAKTAELQSHAFWGQMRALLQDRVTLVVVIPAVLFGLGVGFRRTIVEAIGTLWQKNVSGGLRRSVRGRTYLTGVVLSFANDDKEFAGRLFADLEARGVRGWFAPHDTKSGPRLHERIDRAIGIRRRVLLILSPNSMNSEWVKKEVANARKQEIELKNQVLFLLSLVSFEAIRDWEPINENVSGDLAHAIGKSFVLDFSNWKNPDDYQKAFKRLMEDLKAGEKKR